MATASLEYTDGSLDECFRTVLCGLSGPVRAVVRTVVEGLKLSATTQLAAARALLIQLQAITAPTAALQATIDEARAAIRRQLDLGGILTVNTPDLGGCAPVASLRVNAAVQLDSLLSGLNKVDIDLSRKLSALAEAELVVADLQLLINNYTLTLEFLDACPP